jgi:hypothetical protein
LAFRPIGDLSSETPNFTGGVATPVADPAQAPGRFT